MVTNLLMTTNLKQNKTWIGRNENVLKFLMSQIKIIFYYLAQSQKNY